MSKIGDAIKKKRLEAGFSQNKLAKMAGIAQSTLNAIEGQTRYPTFDTVEMLAKALGCTLYELAGEPTEGIILRPDEQRLIEAYRAASEPIRGAVRDILHIAAEPPARRSAVGAV